MNDSAPVPLILTCPMCGVRHIDEGGWATRPHHTHACQGCGLVWRPAKIDTVGVQFLPGYGPGNDARRDAHAEIFHKAAIRPQASVCPGTNRPHTWHREAIRGGGDHEVCSYCRMLRQPPPQ